MLRSLLPSLVVLFSCLLLSVSSTGPPVPLSSSSSATAIPPPPHNGTAFGSSSSTAPPPPPPPPAPVSALCAAINAQPNLIPNPGFEAGPEGYTLYGESIFVYCGAASAHCGSCYLSIAAIESDAELWQVVDVEPNTTYAFSFWLHSDGGLPNEADVTITFYHYGSPVSTSYVALSVYDVPGNTSSNQYTQHQVLLTSPLAPTTQQLAVFLSVGAYDDQGSLLFDDLRLSLANETVLLPTYTGTPNSPPTYIPPPSSDSNLTASSSTATPPQSSSGSNHTAPAPVSALCAAIDAQPNLIYNPGFELGTAGYSVSGVYIFVSSYTAGAHCGSSFLDIGDSSQDATVSQSVQVAADSTYLFSFWAHVDPSIWDGVGYQSNAVDVTAAFTVNGSLVATAVLYAGRNLATDPGAQYVQHQTLVKSPLADDANDPMMLTLTLGANGYPTFEWLDDLQLYLTDNTTSLPIATTVPYTPPSPSPTGAISSSGVTGSSSSIGNESTVFSYSQSLTGVNGSVVSNVSITFGLNLTATFNGSHFVLTAALGTITSDDGSIDATVVGVTPPNGYSSNDNLMYPYTGGPAFDTAGISVYDTDGVQYNVFNVQQAGAAGFGMVMSSADPTGEGTDAFTVTAPTMAPVCSAASNGTTECALALVTAPSSVLGDPLFIGLRGQSYQVHGIDGAVYALISSPSLSVSARFRFLSGPRPCPVMSFTGMRSTACWSHDGSYLSEVGAMVRATGEAVRAVAGNASHGFHSVEVNGKPVQVAASATGISTTETAPHTATVQLLSSHELVLTAGEFRLTMESVDGFINLRSVEPLVPLGRLTSHGLLGQTWSTQLHKSTLKVIEGEVDDYVIDEGDVLGTHFMWSQYSDTATDTRGEQQQ